ESDEELEQLRECSEHVFVDDLQSSQARDVQDLLRAAVGPVRSGKVRAVTVEFEEWKGADRLRRTLARLNATAGSARERIGEVLEEVRAGKSVPVKTTRSVASELVDSVSRNPQIAQWMTILQSRNQEIAQHSMNVSVLAA